MSDFMGVTFPLQKVTPSDFAIVNRAALTDGILSGCVLSYAGTGLTMEAGDLLICGRHIRHPAAQTWAVDGASTGFARLVLTIDTTKTSTLDAFDMVESSIEYATSEEGFAALTQEDINVDGTRYQVTACIVSLSSGGINDIVQQLPAASAKGTGGVNFKVVGGLTRPADPEENTIWVNTDLEITNAVFSNAEPLEYNVGMVWIKTGYSSNGYLNISPEGLINIYPTECYQYIDDSGSKMQRTAETFRGGKWRDWGTYLFKDGNMCAELTGGWIFPGNPTGTSEACITDTSIHLKYYYGTTDGTLYRLGHTVKAIDFSKIKKLVLNQDWITKFSPNYRMEVKFAIGPSHPRFDAAWYDKIVGSICVITVSDIPYVLDVSSLDEEYFVYVFLEGYETTGAFADVMVDITQIKVEY